MADVTTGLESVLLANRDALLRFLRARGAEDAEDLLQELWIKAASGAGGPIADPLSYLYSVANNLMLDRLRSRMRRERREQDWAKEEPGYADDVAPDPSPERVLLSRERLRAAETVLRELGERTDLIFRRFRLEGVSQAQIASENGISISAVEKHLQRAYRALAELRRD